MIDYGFYGTQYLGSLIPEAAFPEAVSRARDALERFRRIYTVAGSGQVAESMALCAMAEAIYLDGKRAGITSASMGSTSVRYGSQPKSLDRQLLEKAGIYLQIHRGVG